MLLKRGNSCVLFFQLILACNCRRCNSFLIIQIPVGLWWRLILFKLETLQYVMFSFVAISTGLHIIGCLDFCGLRSLFLILIFGLSLFLVGFLPSFCEGSVGGVLSASLGPLGLDAIHCDALETAPARSVRKRSLSLLSAYLRGPSVDPSIGCK